MIDKAAADIVIFGGGIAGLWLLNRLRKAGLSAILFEAGALGGGQTHKSQGIIHGGMKYTLQGFMTQEAKAMADMPTLWKACIAGVGEIDLSSVPILSKQQYLWAPHKLTSKLAGFFAGAALSSAVTPINKTDYPNVFQHENFNGELFALDEIVIDVPVLVRELVKNHQDAIFKIDADWDKGMQFDESGRLVAVTVTHSDRKIEVTAQQFIFTAGAGNERLIKTLDKKEIEMQRRPLQMVLVKTPFHHSLYAHCFGLGSCPRITITTHHTHEGESIWYLGGLLAEEGVNRDSGAQIQAARQELKSLFPWLNFSDAEFASFFIDRAEPKQKGGLKPEGTYFKAIHNMVIAWPTKLALAPKLSADIAAHLATLKPAYFAPHELRSWPMPPLASPIWESMFCKNVA